MGWLGVPLDMMTITIAAISIGIAVDNSIHYIHRYKQEFEVDRNYLQTMYRCHRSIGNALYYTSLTIIIGFSILSLSNFIPSIYFGLLTGLAMLIALFAALTLLPGLLVFIKPLGPEVAENPG
jgi:predicted RND superfamily exporter protein